MKYISLFSFWLFATLCCTSYAHNCDPAPQVIDLTQKFYVKTDQIHFSDNKIYIHVDDITYETPGIFSNEDGYYIQQIAKSGKCAWYEWQCTRETCKFCNLRGIDWSCRVCGKPISQKKR